MIAIPEYRLELRIDGTLIGDVRKLAQNLTWTRRRTKVGVDDISFTVNDVLFNEWLKDRGTDINNILKPLALDCRVVRNGVAVMGGFLATMPSYRPNGTSANLELQFDGYMNYLGGVYIRPIGLVSGRLSDIIVARVAEAESRAITAGKGFGIASGAISQLASVEHTFDNYKSVKDFITDRCDNLSGAGQFDVFFHPDRTYDITPDDEFGDVITDYTIYYPTIRNGVSATSISANEVSGFASHVIGVGAGEISSDPSKSTVITSEQTNYDAVTEYGYSETILQESSVSAQTTLDGNVQAELNEVSDMVWQPDITLIGRQVAPTPNGERKIWVGDTVTIVNREDMTGMTSGAFRVNELSVKVSATGAEEIKPTLERVI